MQLVNQLALCGAKGDSAAVTPLELPEVPRTRLHKAHRPTQSTVCQRGTSNALTSQMRGVKNDFQKSSLSLSMHPS